MLAASGTATVTASCEASGELEFMVARTELADAVETSAKGGSERGSWRSAAKRIEYRVDLAKLADAGQDVDSAARVGQSFAAPMSSVLLVPEPLTTDIPVTVWVETEPLQAFATGLLLGEQADSYRLMAHEIPVATYFAFGKLERKTLDISGARIELTKLDGRMDQSLSALASWIERSAQAVRAFYGEFPMPRTSVTLLPVSGRSTVVFGKVLPESAPGIVLLVGEHADNKALYSDWILIHELFHLGVPSFYGEGKWLDEGLATYYEPIIRVRAGLYTEAQMWDELERSLPQGMPAYTQLGLEQASDFRGIYWGGAIACLVADVEARKRNVTRGLEVGLIALRKAGGNASEVWSLKDAIASIDDALGEPTLAVVAKQHAAIGRPFDLTGLLRSLGVARAKNGSIQLIETAPLAAIRRSIVGRVAAVEHAAYPLQ